MEQPAAQASAKRTRVWPFVVIVLLAVAGGVGWFVSRQPRGPLEAPPVDAGSPGAERDAGPALSIDEGDLLLQKWAGAWSSDALVAQWLHAASLRHLVSATQLVAEGNSPRPALPFVSISGSFAVREEQHPGARPVKKGKKKGPPPPRGERLFISPESYARYDAITRAFGSLDAAAAGEAWSKLEPYCEVAFGEIGRPGARFHDTLAAALERVLSVQVPSGEIEVVGKGAVYLFKDPALESLSPAEKQLLRMGPDNVKVIQDQLRSFASHAGLD